MYSLNHDSKTQMPSGGAQRQGPKIIFSAEVIAKVASILHQHGSKEYVLPPLSRAETLVVAMVHEGRALHSREVYAIAAKLRLPLHPFHQIINGPMTRFRTVLDNIPREIDKFDIVEFWPGGLARLERRLFWGVFDREARKVLGLPEEKSAPHPAQSPGSDLNLMDLPPEIRTTIWEKVLAGPESGLVIEPHADGTRRCDHAEDGSCYKAYALTRDLAATFPLRAFEAKSNWYQWGCFGELYILFPWMRLLCLLFTSKQISREALPVLYKTNRFHARSLKKASLLFTNALHPNVRTHLRSVSLRWDYESRDEAAALFRCLKGMNILRLGIWIEKDWFKDVSDPAELPGMDELCRVPGSLQKIWIEGGWKEFAACVRTNIREYEDNGSRYAVQVVLDGQVVAQTTGETE